MRQCPYNLEGGLEQGILDRFVEKLDEGDKWPSWTAIFLPFILFSFICAVPVGMAIDEIERITNEVKRHKS